MAKASVAEADRLAAGLAQQLAIFWAEAEKVRPKNRALRVRTFFIGKKKIVKLATVLIDVPTAKMLKLPGYQGASNADSEPSGDKIVANGGQNSANGQSAGIAAHPCG